MVIVTIITNENRISRKRSIFFILFFLPFYIFFLLVIPKQKKIKMSDVPCITITCSECERVIFKAESYLYFDSVQICRQCVRSLDENHQYKLKIQQMISEIHRTIGFELELWIRLYLYCKTGILLYFANVCIRIIIDNPDKLDTQFVNISIIVLAVLTFFLAAVTIGARYFDSKVRLSFYSTNLIAWTADVIFSCGLGSITSDDGKFILETVPVLGTIIIWFADCIVLIIVGCWYRFSYERMWSKSLKSKLQEL